MLRTRDRRRATLLRSGFVIRRGERGVSMVEMAILSPLYLLLVVACIFAGDCTLAKIGCVQAAREGAWMLHRYQQTGGQRFFQHIPGRISTRTIKRSSNTQWTSQSEVRTAIREGLGSDPLTYVWAGEAAKLLNTAGKRSAIDRGEARFEFTLDPIGASGWFQFPKPKFVSYAVTDLPGTQSRGSAELVQRNKDKIQYKNNRPWHEVMDGTPGWPRYRKKNSAWDQNFYPQNPIRWRPIVDFESPF
ncbi:MAG: pilus assembly protein [Planctomycetes bacterium]|nr:pilus assembly protein [Planctomycetota bacterium]